MKITRFLAVASLCALAACQGAQTVSDTKAAVDKTATAVTVIQGNAPLLTKAAAAACAGQAIANATADMLNATGHAAAALNAATVSAKLGIGCTWATSTPGT